MATKFNIFIVLKTINNELHIKLHTELHILQRVKEDSTLLKTQKRRRQKWFVYIFRHNPFVSNKVSGGPCLKYIKQVF